MRSLPWLAGLIGVTVLALVAGARAEAQPSKAPDAEQILKNFVVVGDSTQGKPLPKIGVVQSLSLESADVTVQIVLRRDLDLCGEFELLPDDAAPDGLILSDTPVDVAAWKKKGAEAVVRVSGKKQANGKVRLSGQAYFTDSGDQPVYDKSIEVDATRVRFESHRVADAIIGALTGTPGGFTSQMTFIYGTGKARRVYKVDADGHDPHAVSTEDQLALAPAFGKNQQLYYAASVKKGAFKIFSAGNPTPIILAHRGSVYGLDFNHDRSQVAVAIAQGPTIKLFRGPDLKHLEPASSVGMALHPAWSPSGKLAFAGEGQWGQRIYVDGKAVSPAGLFASAPAFCRHPDGIRLVYMVGVGKNTDLVATGESGGQPVRLTQNMGRNGYPSCSPDGRLVAFFSTRTFGEGPGLYIMRIDGRRPKRVSTLVGDTLRWARVPE